MRKRLFEVIAKAIGVALLAPGCAGRTQPRAQGQESVVCPHDAVAVGGACRCAPGLFVLEGACVGSRELDAYCGVVTRGAGVCPTPVCKNEDPIDLATETCGTAGSAREIVSRVRPVPDDLKLGCREGRVLVVLGDSVTCLPLEDVCARGTDWDPSRARCVPPPACAPGEVRGGEACVRVVTRKQDGVAVTDIGRWARAVLGTEGGEGTARLCRPLAQQAWDLDVGPGGARTLTLTVELVFPDNDLTQLSGKVTTVDGASGLAVLGDGGRAAQKAVDALLVPLRALGGASDAASAAVRVRCTVRGGGVPSFVPR